MKRKLVETTRSKSEVPAWAILTEAENRNLYKPEPPRKHLRGEERFLLTFFRKLGRDGRLKVALIANSLALARIRERLAKGRKQPTV